MGRESSSSREQRLKRAGDWLKAERLQRKLTQAQLGQALGINQVQVSTYERGAYEVESGIAKDIARVFEISQIDVFCGLEIDGPDELAPLREALRGRSPDEVAGLLAPVLSAAAASRMTDKQARARRMGVDTEATRAGKAPANRGTADRRTRRSELDKARIAWYGEVTAGRDAPRPDTDQVLLDWYRDVYLRAGSTQHPESRNRNRRISDTAQGRDRVNPGQATSQGA